MRLPPDSRAAAVRLHSLSSANKLSGFHVQLQGLQVPCGSYHLCGILHSQNVNKIQTTLRPASIPYNVVTKRLGFRSVHTRTFAGYGNLASDASPVDVVQSPTPVLPI